MVNRSKMHFYGGIHPSNDSDKAISSTKPIKSLIPKEVKISLEQAVGRMSKCIVKKGDKVELGQLIGEPDGFGTSNVHASVPGVVVDVTEEVSGYNATIRQVVVIKTDQSYIDNPENEVKSYQKELVPVNNHQKDDILQAMKDGGLIGMGGAGFPANIKFETTEKIESLLINAAECEPYLTCDHLLMLEHGYEIINGIQLLLKSANIPKAIICIEDNKKDAADNLDKILENSGLAITTALVPTKYPQGGERQLVQTMTGKEVPINGLPAHIGVIISNVGTAKAMADIVFGDQPLITRCITITGNVNDPSNFIVPIGTSFQKLVEAAGGCVNETNRVIHGGPMTGSTIANDVDSAGIPGSVKKISSGIVILDKEDFIESPCIRCGECEKVCPAKLSPFKIDFAAIEDDLKLCDELYATECISCGSCSYVCPAKRELAWRITIAKEEIYNQRRKGGVK